MYGRLTLAAAAIASLAACGSAGTSSGSSPASQSSPAGAATAAPASPNPIATVASGGSGGSTATYVRRFREEFPQLAQGKTDVQITGDGEADCSDMADAWKITTPSMARRYGLSSSTADQFILHNVALLDMFTLCPTR